MSARARSTHGMTPLQYAQTTPPRRAAPRSSKENRPSTTHAHSPADLRMCARARRSAMSTRAWLSRSPSCCSSHPLASSQWTSAASISLCITCLGAARCAHACTHACKHALTCARTHVCAHVRTCLRTCHIPMSAHASVHMSKRHVCSAHAYMSAHTSVHMYGVKPVRVYRPMPACMNIAWIRSLCNDQDPR